MLILDLTHGHKTILDIFLTNHPSLVDRSIMLSGLSEHDGVPMIIVSDKPHMIKTKPRHVYCVCQKRPVEP